MELVNRRFILLSIDSRTFLCQFGCPNVRGYHPMEMYEHFYECHTDEELQKWGINRFLLRDAAKFNERKRLGIRDTVARKDELGDLGFEHVYNNRDETFLKKTRKESHAERVEQKHLAQKTRIRVPRRKKIKRDDDGGRYSNSSAAALNGYSALMGGHQGTYCEGNDDELFSGNEDLI